MNYQTSSGFSISDKRGKRVWLTAICGLYLVLAGIFSTTTLDVDEFTFLREPYEMLGGDYTLGYLKQHDYGNALRTLAKSYYFFWTYRPLNSPVVKESDRVLFADEEAKFGYVRPSAPQSDDASAVESYKARLIVPEPEEFYTDGAGKGLLPAILSIPQLALMKALGIGSDRLLTAQFHQQYDFAFTFCRLAQILAGIVSVILVFKILERYVNLERAYLGTLIFAIFPVTIKYFPNIHHNFRFSFPSCSCRVSLRYKPLCRCRRSLRTGAGVEECCDEFLCRCSGSIF